MGILGILERFWGILSRFSGILDESPPESIQNPSRIGPESLDSRGALLDPREDWWDARLVGRNSAVRAWSKVVGEMHGESVSMVSRQSGRERCTPHVFISVSRGKIRRVCLMYYYLVVCSIKRR